jgi:hypothetical protein
MMIKKYVLGLAACVTGCIVATSAAAQAVATKENGAAPVVSAAPVAPIINANAITPAATVFKQLSALVGEWEGKFDNGRVHRVTYRLSARGHALVELWALSPTSESITIYHLDGDKLVADHYCPQGNAPRLELANVADDKLNFAFRDGTNLNVVGKTHQHSFWLQIKSADEYLRSETYVVNGSNAAQLALAKADGTVRYSRVKP